MDLVTLLKSTVTVYTKYSAKPEVSTAVGITMHTVIHSYTIG